jgi:hypothetical protein
MIGPDAGPLEVVGTAVLMRTQPGQREARWPAPGESGHAIGSAR